MELRESLAGSTSLASIDHVRGRLKDTFYCVSILLYQCVVIIVYDRPFGVTTHV